MQRKRLLHICVLILSNGMQAALQQAMQYTCSSNIPLIRLPHVHCKWAQTPGGRGVVGKLHICSSDMASFNADAHMKRPGPNQRLCHYRHKHGDGGAGEAG